MVLSYTFVYVIIHFLLTELETVHLGDIKLITSFSLISLYKFQ